MPLSFFCNKLKVLGLYNMIVLQETNQAQVVKFIPTRVNDLSYDSEYLIRRVQAENATIEATRCLNETLGVLPTILKLRNETTNVLTTQTIACSIQGFYYTFSAVLTLEQGHFYTIELYADDDTLIHRDKIFCTNQNVSTYSVNDGEYVPSGGNIIFYE